MTDKDGRQGTEQPKLEMIPSHVRAGQVISLVEVTGGLGSTIDASRLADELGADIAVLLPILDTAEMLGLVKSEKGDISLTEFGLKFQKASKQKVRLVRERLSQIEPLKTALDLASRKREVTAGEVAEALLERGAQWHHEPEINEALVQALLVHWSIYAGLLTYNGKTGKFQKV